MHALAIKQTSDNSFLCFHHKHNAHFTSLSNSLSPSLYFVLGFFPLSSSRCSQSDPASPPLTKSPTLIYLHLSFRLKHREGQRGQGRMGNQSRKPVSGRLGLVNFRPHQSVTISHCASLFSSILLFFLPPLSSCSNHPVLM